MRTLLYDQGDRGRHGTGLPISSAIVTKHGGKTEVESEIGKSTTFTVILPTTNEMPFAQDNNNFHKMNTRKAGKSMIGAFTGKAPFLYNDNQFIILKAG